MMTEVRYSGRVTKHAAQIGTDVLAVAYKIDGRKITLADARSLMIADNREISSVINYYTRELNGNPGRFDANSVRMVREKLAQISQFIEHADQNRVAVSKDKPLDDDPISRSWLPRRTTRSSLCSGIPTRLGSSRKTAGSWSVRSTRSSSTCGG
jgi:hypothetical protein